MAKGILTVQAAHAYQEEFNQQGFDILYDHGQRGIDSPLRSGKIRAWFGDTYVPETILADLDMAVVSHNKERVYALIEIEETTRKPKVILGDVLATLLGKGIKFQGQRDLQVGKWTTLIVMMREPNPPQEGRLAFLNKQSNYLRENLLTPNASMGQVMIETFLDYPQLESKLRDAINYAINKRGSW
jgi:hypothetical protein